MIISIELQWSTLDQRSPVVTEVVVEEEEEEEVVVAAAAVVGEEETMEVVVPAGLPSVKSEKDFFNF